MAAGAVTFLLNKLTEYIEKEEALLAGIKKEVQSINVELSFMKDFLLEVTDEDSAGLQELAAQVRDVAYDTEYAVDDYKLRIAHDHGQGFYAHFERSFHFVKSSFARHSISVKLRDSHSRMQNVSKAYQTHIIAHGLTPGHQLNSSSRRSGATVLSNALLVEEAELVGIDIRKKKLVEWLVEDKSELRVISVVGMPGLGKTTVAKRAYEDPDVRAHFLLRAWISLTQPFQIEDLLKDMIQQFYEEVRMPDISEMGKMDTGKLRDVIHNFLLLQGERFLIVLDDVCHESDWLNFGPLFPNNCGGRILLTTRETDVAKTCSARCPENVDFLNPLSEEDSWALFRNVAFPNTSCPPHLERVSKKILEKCEGLPLAIVAVGGALVNFDRSRKDEWEKFYSLGNVFTPGNRFTQVLLLSYNCLPHHLHSCLMYFSIFPEGVPIERMRLVRLWIAEGFVKERDGLTLEDVATSYLKELVNRNLVQVVEATIDGQVKTCRVHHLLREIMVLKAKKEGFFACVNENSSDFPKKVRRLAIYNAKASLRQRRCPSQLCSVLMFWRPLDSKFDEWHMFDLSSRRLRLLNVLELRGAPLNSLPDGIVNLPSLKYLSLRDTNVRSIPRSIGKLKNLETLDLKHAPINELPDEVSKLQKLRHLLVYHYETKESGDQVRFKRGFKAPAQIGELLSLQKLCFLEMDDDLLSKLRNLKQLTRLGILKLQEKDGKSLCLLIKAQENLLALSVTSASENEFIDIEGLTRESCPKFLRRLYLTGRLEKLPNWISALDNLAKVVLKGSRLAHDDPLLALQDLPNLVHLELIQVYDGETLTFQCGKFQKLKFLGLNKFDGLRLIIVNQSALPLLEELIVVHCHGLQKVPCGVKFMSALKSLKFFDMPLDFIRRLRHDGGEDYHKVENVREVIGTYQINGGWEVYSKANFEGGGNTAGPSTSSTANQYDWKLP